MDIVIFVDRSLFPPGSSLKYCLPRWAPSLSLNGAHAAKGHVCFVTLSRCDMNCSSASLGRFSSTGGVTTTASQPDVLPCSEYLATIGARRAALLSQSCPARFNARLRCAFWDRKRKPVPWVSRGSDEVDSAIAYALFLDVLVDTAAPVVELLVSETSRDLFDKAWYWAHTRPVRGSSLPSAQFSYRNGSNGGTPSAGSPALSCACQLCWKIARSLRVPLCSCG